MLLTFTGTADGSAYTMVCFCKQYAMNIAPIQWRLPNSEGTKTKGFYTQTKGIYFCSLHEMSTHSTLIFLGALPSGNLTPVSSLTGMVSSNLNSGASFSGANLSRNAAKEIKTASSVRTVLEP